MDEIAEIQQAFQGLERDHDERQFIQIENQVGAEALNHATHYSLEQLLELELALEVFERADIQLEVVSELKNSFQKLNLKLESAPNQQPAGDMEESSILEILTQEFLEKDRKSFHEPCEPSLRLEKSASNASSNIDLRDVRTDG
jgi:hypothetical protein